MHDFSYHFTKIYKTERKMQKGTFQKEKEIMM